LAWALHTIGATSHNKMEVKEMPLTTTDERRRKYTREILNVLSETYREESGPYKRVERFLLNKNKVSLPDLDALWLMVTTSK